MSAIPTRTRATPSQRPEAAELVLQPDTSANREGQDQIGSSEHAPLPVQICQPICNRVTIQNRVPVLLVHIPKLSIRGQARLATEVGVSRSTVSRLVNGKINPSYRLARGVTDALERFLGRPLDMRDVFSTDGTYLTPSGCALCRCGGCLPEAAWGDDGTLKPEWKDARPGDWSLARPANPGTDPDDSAGAGKEGK